LNTKKVSLQGQPIYFSKEKDNYSVELAMEYNDSYSETIFCFANNINTKEGGTHLVGFKTALTSVVNDYIKQNNMNKGKELVISGDDTREGFPQIRRHWTPRSTQHSLLQPPRYDHCVPGRGC